VIAKSPLRGKYDTRVDPVSAFEILQRRLAGGAAPAGAAPDAAPPPAGTGVLTRIGDKFRDVFGVGRARGTRLTTSQSMARNVVRAVATGMATQIASGLAKSTGSKTAGTIGKAVVRGALGGVLRR
jgi:uncharacterized protein